MAHLDPARYTIVPVGITREGTWVRGTEDVSTLRIQGRTMPEVDAASPRVALATSAAEAGTLRYVDADRAGDILATVDVVFPVLHGPCGEDGTVQGLLELSGVPYVGPGVFASAAAMDKEFTKKVLGQAGLPIGTHVVLRRGQGTLSAAERDTLGLPVFVKPARGGSSIGISKVTTWERLDAAIALARMHDTKVIVEAAVVGREVECGVLELPSGEVRASMPAEIHFPDGPAEPHEAGHDTASDAFYDFDTKYLDGVCTFDLPAALSDDVTAQLRDMAITAFDALDAAGLARVDFFVTDSGMVINEVNTMPGFTPISMYPQMWQATGIDYSDLLDTLIATALQRATT